MQKSKYLVCFAILEHLYYDKSKALWKSVNFSEGCRVACSFNKFNAPSQMKQIVPNPNQGAFAGCFDLFFQFFFENQSFFRHLVFPEGESIISIFILHQQQLVSKSYFLTLSSSEILPTCKEGDAVILSNFQQINKYCNVIGLEDLV